jgi:hypothetical protein
LVLPESLDNAFWRELKNYDEVVVSMLAEQMLLDLIAQIQKIQANQR